jgi:hypothetical protein
LVPFIPVVSERFNCEKNNENEKSRNKKYLLTAG